MALDIRDSDGTTRLHGDIASAAGAIGDVLTKQADGTYAPATPAATAVSCVLAREADITVTDVANYDVDWDKLYDNLWDQNELLAIPAGLGLDFDFDGSADLVVPTESGVWSLSYFGTRDPDDTWSGSVRLGGIGINIPWADIIVTPFMSGAFTGALPAGTQLTNQVATTRAGTTPTKVTQVYLSIVRIA